MRRSSVLGFCLIAIGFCGTVFAADLEWRQYGPPGARVQVIDASPGLEYFLAVSPQAIFRSDDRGLNWQALSGPTLVTGDYLVDVAIPAGTDEVVLAMTRSKGLLRGKPTGGPWIESNLGITLPTPPYGWQFIDMDITDSTPERIFISCSTGVYWSSDFGGHWQRIALPNENSYPAAYQLEASSDGSVYLRSYTLFRIEADLTTHTFMVGKPGLPYRQIQGMIWPDPKDPNRLILIDQEVYYSSDRGEHWSQPVSGEVPVSPKSALWLGQRPVVLGENEAYELNPETQSWTRLWTRPLGDTYGLIPASEDGSTLLLWGIASSVWRSTNGGATWTYSAKGMPGFGEVRAVAVSEGSPRAIFAGMSQSGVWRTKDDGLTWTPVNTGMEADPAYQFSVRTMAVDPRDAKHLLASFERTAGTPQHLYATSNTGDSWSRITNAPEQLVAQIHFMQKTSGVVLLGTLGDGVWRSTDNGKNFSKVVGFPQYSNINAIAEEKNGRLFAAQEATFNTQGGVWYSDNSGASWTFTTSAEDPTKVGGLRAMASDRQSAGRVMGCDPGGNMWFTSNNGANWTQVQNGIPWYSYNYPYGEPLGVTVYPGHAGSYWTSLRGNGIFATTNEGADWSRIGANALTSLTYSERNQGTLFGGGEGLYYTQLIEPLPTLTPTPTATATNTPKPTSTPVATDTPRMPPSPTVTPTRPAAVNIGVADDTFALSPESPAVGNQASATVRVYNNGTVNVTNAPIAFYWRSDSTPLTSLGRTTIASLPARSWTTVSCPSAIPVNSPGTYYVSAKADPDGSLTESEENDNQAEISFYARQAGSDKTAPTGSIRVAGGSLFTHSWTVYLDLQATDNDSGVKWMYVTAWAFDPNIAEYYPYYVSDWIAYTPYASFELLGMDSEAISVNYADADCNVSPTYWGYINYTPNYTDYVWWDWINWHVYYLKQGAQVTLTALVQWGDPDLYVIAPSTPPGYADWVSDQAGAVTENVQFIAPETGFYLVGIYGYDDSIYTLLGSSNAAGKEGLQENPRRKGALSDDRRRPDLNAKPGLPEPPSTIRVPSVGNDLNDDGQVNYADAFLLSRQWGLTPGAAGYDARVGSIRPGEPIGPAHVQQWLRLRR
jgi:photosystem II stability/assembly factor-like uncharacterized protein